MELKSEIFGQLENGTISELFVNGQHYAYIPEDPLREVKIPKITGIPCGLWRVILTYSPKYSMVYFPELCRRIDEIVHNLGHTDNEELAELMKQVAIPEIICDHFSGVRFHKGNFTTDTDACQMPNKSYGLMPDGKSWRGFESATLAYDLNKMIIEAIKQGETVTFEKVIRQ